MQARADFRCVLECQPAQPTTHRYLLAVALTPPARRSRRTLVVIQKNPSLADAVRSDPTAGKVEAWARRHAYDTVFYVNLFALRSPYPTALNDVALAMAIGPENDAALHDACAHASAIVAAWGNPNGVAHTRYRARSEAVVTLLRARQQPVYCVGALTRLGYPRHGLHWNGDAAQWQWIP